MRIAATIAAYLSLAVPTIAGDLRLQTPIDCDLGETCFVQQYVDHDAGPKARDFTCGTLSYDGHKGTDFGLPSLAAMHSGIDVLAAAPGVVAGMRDGMNDVAFTPQTAQSVEGRECGNGVVIKHGDGWQTQYCHMKKGSVRVRSGDRVAAGTVLGQVGLSGKTQFPHLHLSVRKDGNVIDPYAPQPDVACGPVGNTLWETPLPYTPTGILNAGFADGIPSFETIKSGPLPQPMRRDDEALVLWVYAFGALPDDDVRLEIHGPAGQLIGKTLRLERTQAQYFRAVGKRRPSGGFSAGRYTGTIALRRNGQVIDQHRVQINVE